MMNKNRDFLSHQLLAGIFSNHFFNTFSLLIDVFTMGIKGLTKLLTTSAAASIKQSVLSKYTGRTIAIDASMLIYQFLVCLYDSTAYENDGNHKLAFIRLLFVQQDHNIMVQC